MSVKILKPFKYLLRLLVILLILIILGIIGLTVKYFAYRENAENYLSRDFLVHVQVNSLAEVYKEVLDLPAIEAFLADEQFAEIYQALLNFRANPISRAKWVQFLLDMQAHVQIFDQNRALVVLDLGIRSTATTFLPLFHTFYKDERIPLGTEQHGAERFYFFPSGDSDGSGIYFQVRENLLIASPDAQVLSNAVESTGQRDSLAGDNVLTPVYNKLPDRRNLTVFLQSQSLMDQFFPGNQGLERLTRNFIFDGISAVGIEISEQRLSLDLALPYQTQEQELLDYLNYSPAPPGVLNILPDNTTLFSAFCFEDFPKLFSVLSLFQSEEEQTSLQNIEELSQGFTGISFDDIFSWIGNSAGMLTLSDNPGIIVYAHVRDFDNFYSFEEKIDNAILLATDDSLVVDGVRLSRIAFPGFISSLVDVFVPGLSIPYYVIKDDFLFFSTDPEALAHIGVQEERTDDDLLKNAPAFVDISSQVPDSAQLTMYYDLSESRPYFLRTQSVLTDLLSQYGKGRFALYNRDSTIMIRFTTTGQQQQQTRSVAGYPLEIDDYMSDFLCFIPKQGAVPVFSYINNNNELILSDTRNLNRHSAAVPPGSHLALSADKSAIAVFTPGGDFLMYSMQAELVTGFPVQTSGQGSFLPVATDTGFIFFDFQGNRLMSINSERNISPASPEMPFPVINPVSQTAASGMIAAYSRSFQGQLYYIDPLTAQSADGWPKPVQGMSLASPAISDRYKLDRIAFLTQTGDLNVWAGKDGGEEVFSVSLEGAFYDSPVFTEIQGGPAILTHNSDGLVSIYSDADEILSQDTPELSGDKMRAIVFDVNEDGTGEIFFYGQSNNIHGFDSQMQPIPGFPVQGFSKPVFLDLNFDEEVDLVSISIDGKVCAYSVRR